jgi:uncharacterized protein YqfA (UPF0365 family)
MIIADSALIAIPIIALMSLFGVMLLLWIVPLQLWIAAWSSGAYVGLMTLIAMRLRRVAPTRIVNPFITATKAGLNVEVDMLESPFLAGGNVDRVVNALISADKAGIPMTFQQAAAIDLAGRNVLEAVRTSVDPKVIDCPDPTRGASNRRTLDGVAKDGIQLKARARVTVRTNLQQLVGGATEDTIIARVGEGIVSAIGSSLNHKEVLKNPMLIAKAVLDKGLDSQTAYEIVSIDIADIDVGDNVGARLQADQAEADMRIARARAEERRARAVAEEQEFKALTEESRAKVILAEAEVPTAMAESYRSGNLRAGGKSK